MRLTLPAVEPGFCDVMVDGRKVGHVIDIWDDGPGHTAWEAHLWKGPEHEDEVHETVVRKRLKDLRADLRERLDQRGPWWTA